MPAKYNYRRLHAIPLLPYRGRRMWRWPITVTEGAVASVLQVDHYPQQTVWVIAPTAGAALDLVQEEFPEPCTELECWGPRAGLAGHRYAGWFTSIGRALLECRRPAATQLPLPLAGVGC